MEKDKRMRVLEGTLTALSHTFIIREDVFFLMELYCRGSACHIMIRHISQQQWRHLLHINSRYRITDLLPQTLYQGKLPFLHARRTSQLTKLEDNVEHDDLCGVSLRNGLISYKGVVTAVIDQDLGIWELDGSIHLVVSFLNDVTGEIWNRYDDEYPEDMQMICGDTTEVSSVTTNEAKRQRGYLKVGDAISVYHVHHSKISGTTYLTCCGRSLLLNNRPSEMKRSITRSVISILDILHLYNPSLLGLHWLIGVRNHLRAALCPHFVEEILITRRKNGNEEDNLLSKLVEEATCRGLVNAESRSFVKEFLLPDHDCVVSKKFAAPFMLMKIKELKAEATIEEQEIADQGTPRFWSHSLNRKDQSCVVVGKLCIGNNGVLQLFDASDRLDVAILGTQTQLLNGSVMALFNFVVVVEEFNILVDGNYKNLQKKYIVVNIDDVVLLRTVNKPKRAILPNHEFNISIISKSSVMCIQPHVRETTPRNLSLERFFVAKAVISQTSSEGKVEKWDNFVRFCGKLALAHPCIEVGNSYTMLTEGLRNPEVVLKKTFTNTWLTSLQNYFGTCECIYIPEETTVVDVSQGQPRTNSVDITSLLDGKSEINEPITVIGVIKERQLMTPKYNSEINYYPVSFCNDHHIGVPGSKILRILLCDSFENADTMVWIYFNGSYNQYIPQYPLGMLPGVKVSVSFLLRKVSKQTNRVYLQCTNYSQFTPLSVPNPSPNSNPSPPYHYLKEASNQQGPFQVIAFVECIQSVTMRCICCACNSDMVDGMCSYVGCSSPNGGKVGIYAKIIIEDGSGTAVVSMDSLKHLQTLLQLTDEQFSSLCQEIVQSCGSLSHHFSHRLKGGLNTEHEFSDAAFTKLCSSSECLRPLKFNCRGFSQQSEDVANLYCLDVLELDPLVDCKIWESKVE